MKKTFLCALAALTFALSFAPRAEALTLPDFGRYYFVGTTDQLQHIRAAMAKVAGIYEADAYTFPAANTYAHTLISPPFLMGAVDCLDSYYAPDQGPFDGAEDYLGMSVSLPDGIVEIPALEDLVQQGDPEFPGECFGYLFYRWCVEPGTDWAALYSCPDPEPPPPEMDGGV